jgi:hypothetical protein
MKQEFIAQALTSPLNFAVALVGVFVFAFGLFGALRPPSLTAFVGRIWASPPGAGLILVVRAALGFLLIAAASGTLFPKTLFVLGVLALVKALSIPLLGRTRQQKILKWWCLQPARYIRDWSLLACAFGLFLTYAATSARNDVINNVIAKSERFLAAKGECTDARSAILYLLLSGASR